MSRLVEDLERQFSTLARNLRDPVVLPDGTVVQRSSASLLCLLADHAPVRMGVISAALDVDPSTTTRQVQYAIRLGLVARDPDPDDGRAMLLSLTPLGRATYVSLVDRQRKGLMRILDGWPDKDQAELLRLLSSFNREVGDLRAAALGRGPLN